MGQKVHSIGLRLGTNRKWKSSWFCDLNNYGKFLHLNLQIEKFIKTFLLLQPKKSILVDCKILKSSNNTLYIFVWFYKYRKNILMNLSERKQKYLEVNTSNFNRKFLLNSENFLKEQGQLDVNSSLSQKIRKPQWKNLTALPSVNETIYKKFERISDYTPIVKLSKMNKGVIENKLKFFRKKLSFLLFLIKQHLYNQKYISLYKFNLILKQIQKLLINIFFYNNILINWKTLKLSQPSSYIWSTIVNNYKKKIILKHLIKKNKSIQNYFFNIQKRIYKFYKNKSITLQSVQQFKRIHRYVIRVFCFKNQINKKKQCFKKDFSSLYKDLFLYQLKDRSDFQQSLNNIFNYKLKNQKQGEHKNFLLPQKKLFKQNLSINQNKQFRNQNSINIINGNKFLFLDKFYFNLSLRDNNININSNILNSFDLKKCLINFYKYSFLNKNFILEPISIKIFFYLYRQRLKNYLNKKLKGHLKFLYTALINYNPILCSKINWIKLLNFYIEENLKKINFQPIFYSLEENKKILYKYLLHQIKLNTWCYLYFYHFQKKWLNQVYTNSQKLNESKMKQKFADFWNFDTSKKLQNILLKKKLFIWKELKKQNNLLSGVITKWKNYKRIFWSKFFNKIKQKNSWSSLDKRKKTFYKQYVLRQLYSSLNKSRRSELVNFYQYLYLIQNNKFFQNYLNNISSININLDLYKKLELLLPFNNKQYRQLKRLLFISGKKKERFLSLLKSLVNDQEKFSNIVITRLQYFLSKKERKKYILKQLGGLMTIQTLQKSLHVLTKLNVKLIFINALSFTNFQYYYSLKNNFNIKKQKSIIQQRFRNLDKITKNFIRRWKRLSFWTSDLVNISVISMFLKNTDLLANFIAYQISFLPKNKKQTAFLKFLTKVIFNFKGERKEIVGFKMRFKGRFNRWSRTKKWIANVGNLWFQTYNICLNYSYHKGIVKKGVFSTQIWLQYKKDFINTLKKNSLTYFNYSKIKQFKRKLQ